MPRRRDHADAVTQRRATVARLYCQGVTQARIAAAVGVTQQQVSLDMAAVRREWQRVMVREFDRLKAEQLAKIDATEAAAWQGWRRSLRDAEKKTVKKGEGASETETREGQAGDPRFLQIVMDCVDRRLKLIGAYPKENAPPPAAEVIFRVYGPALSQPTPPAINGEHRELPDGE